jgi:hypothetical protein
MMTLKNMTPKKEISRNLLLGFLISQFCVSTSLAQFEDFPPPPPPGISDESGAIPPSFQEPIDTPPSFSEAAPYAPPNTPPLQNAGPGNSGSGPSTQYIKPSKGNAKTSILSEKQKSKFAKAHPEDITS